MVGGIAVAGAAWIFIGQFGSKKVPATEVIHTIRKLATQPNGGEIGPWWICAGDADPISGDLLNFNVESGSVRLGAARAKVVIDADADTFSFVMSDVVYTAAPPTYADENDGSEPVVEGSLIETDQYVLGPVAWPANIIDDVGNLAEAARRLSGASEH